MLAVDFTAGGTEGLSVTNHPIPELQANQILIQVHATAINRADTLQRKGLYAPPAGESHILGLEAAGLVEKLGPGASRWKPGQRVMALLGGGGNAEFVAVHEDHVLPVPDSMSMEDAAALPEVWLTAFQLLTLVGGLHAGETVLIHAAGSGVGTAAIQLVNLLGGTALAVAGTEAKLDQARELGAKLAVNYKLEDFSQKVLDVTNGRGVDLILDCVGASFWEKNAAAIATDGRWVLYGLLGGGSVNGNILAKLLRKRATLTATTLRARDLKYKASLVSAFTERALPEFNKPDAKLKVVVDQVLPLDQIAEAHRAMEANENSGKIVLTVTKEKSKDREEL